MKKKWLPIVSLSMAILLTTPAFAGQWRVDNTGWWYQENNGSYPRDAWKAVDGSWYYFYSNGYMAHDTWINGLYYVGSDGRMLTNTITPDGYHVGADGRWIQNTQKKLTRDQVEKAFQKYWDYNGYSSPHGTSYWNIYEMTDRYAYIYERWYTGYHGEATVDLITGDCIETGPIDVYLPAETKYLFNAWTY